MTTERPLTSRIRSGHEPPDLRAYEQAGGYQGLRRALKMTPEEVQAEVSRSGLCGRGGAGFSTGKKWSFVPMGPEARHPKYFVVNADEMEPGTMKDRVLLEGDPHGVVEGTLASAYAVGADVAYIFLRWEYRLSAARLTRAIAEAYAAGYAGKNVCGSSWSVELYLHTSAGRYMCGDETGLLDALEGRRASPRNKPPYPQVAGLWGKPTVVNNVETVACVPHIIARGAEWFRTLGRGGGAGTKLYGVSGRVKNPGVWELPMGTTAREIIDQYAGGMKDGLACRAVIPGGASTNFVLAKDLDLPMDFGSLEKVGSRMGTGTMIVLDDRTCPVGMVLSMERFFARESCGWCTPCREGLPWVARTLEAIEEGRGEEGDMEVLRHHADLLAPGNTFCALAPGAADPLRGALDFFRDDFERHIREKRCPFGGPRSVVAANL
jgi:NADH-quinone oxidoreductase subunit F